ncbi:hypothetical protein ACLKA6_006051 [Drosophila palustris]
MLDPEAKYRSHSKSHAWDHPDLALELKIGVNKVLSDVQQKMLLRTTAAKRSTEPAPYAAPNVGHTHDETLLY